MARAPRKLPPPSGLNGRPPIATSLDDATLELELALPVVNIKGPNSAKLNLDPQLVAGFIAPFGGRARVILVSLLNGCSKQMSAAAAGISTNTMRMMTRRDPAFAEAVETADSIGFGAVYESEIYDRALDRDDRASGRLLELVAKSRSSAYRDKVQGQLDVVHRFDRSIGAVTSGWKPDTPTD